MSKEIDLIKCIIFEIDKSLYSDFGGNLCISYTPNLKKLLLALNTPEVRYYFDNQDQKIKDLEVKLTESKKQCQKCKHLNKKIELNIKNKLINENQQLKQQLAEKDKEISEYIKIVDDLHKQLSDKCDFCDKTKDQDKISFAVEQLEKVKEEMDLRPRGVSKGWKNKEYDTLVEEDVYEVIDNQIKSNHLKEKDNG